MRRRSSTAVLVVFVIMGLVALGAPASADHTDPNQPLSPTTGAPPPDPLLTFGSGTWNYIRNFQANPGTDLEFFTKSERVWSSTGTLGQADEGHVGQRMLQLATSKTVNPQFRADHGSANCPTANPTGTLGLQHDTQVTPKSNPQLIIDTTDATGRCHDSGGGGLEFIDINKLGTASFAPREIHLTRHAGTSHTVTVDATRPGIVYNSSAQFGTGSGPQQAWIDVLDIRTCLGLRDRSLAQKRNLCRPKVYRIPFQPTWSQQLDNPPIDDDANNDGLEDDTESSCHDITAKPGRLYCAALSATLIFDVSGLTDAGGAIKGTPLPCTVVEGTQTGAKVTDCSANNTTGGPQAQGWQFLGTFNHPGRSCNGDTNKSCNNNDQVRSTEGVAVSHESDPTPNQKTMFVTDERGGGVVSPGSSCQPGIDNPFGNGGLHAFDITNPSNIHYELKPDGSKAVWIGEARVPAPTFCDIHVIEHIPDEQRVIVAYYTQGTKILDYFIDANGRFTFRETANLVLPNANTWAVENFRIRNHSDGTRTYFLLANDIERGIDIFSWRGPRNPIGASPSTAGLAPPSHPSRLGDVVLLGLALVVLPAAALLGRRRRAYGRLGWSMILKP